MKSAALKKTVNGLAVAMRLLHLREMRGLTLQTLGLETGITPGNLCKYEAGNYLPNSVALLRLARCHDVAMEWILTGENRKEKS